MDQEYLANGFGDEETRSELCGIKQWTPKNEKYRYIVILYKTNQFEGTLKSSAEGKVFWIDRKDIEQYTLALGFEDMLEVFENEVLSENYHWYEDGQWKQENK